MDEPVDDRMFHKRVQYKKTDSRSDEIVGGGFFHRNGSTW